MNRDDVFYLICLLSSIGISPIFRTKLKSFSERKIYGTCFGILTGFIVSGFHLLHCFLSFGICALIITQIHPSKSHVISFIFMFGYLAIFRTITHFGFSEPPGPTNMIQMILTLKLIGVAFEKNTSNNKILQRNKELEKADKDDKTSKPLAEKVELTEYDIDIQSITISELFHYCFNYMGLLTGPYYRYRTYRDYFETPFKDYANASSATLTRLKYVIVFGMVHFITSYLFPLSYASTDEFYEQRSFFFRAFYIWPQFVIFRFRLYAGLLLGECVCTNSGFGAYPDDSNVAKGEGPKSQYLHLKRNPEELRYNFDTIQNIDVYKVETIPTFKEALRYWNVCVQYWLAINVYKRFPNKKFRTSATLLVSAFWHGFYPGHYFCIMGAPFYFPVEDMYAKLFQKNATGVKRVIVDLGLNTSKFFILSYLNMAFVLLSFDKFWRYYSSVYHYGYIYYIIMLVIGLAIKYNRKQSNYSKDKKEKITIEDTTKTETIKKND